MRVRVFRWGAGLLWMALIYALAPQTFGLVRWTGRYLATGRYGQAVGVVLALLALGLLGRLLRRRFSWRSRLAALAGILAAGALFFHTPPGVARVHLLLFGILGVLWFRAARFDLPDAPAFATALLLSATAGVGDELLQGLLPRRVGDLSDVITDVLAALVAIVLWRLVCPRTERPPTANAHAWLTRAGVLLCLSCAAFMAWNPDLHFGYRHRDTLAGTFFSVYTLEELKQEDHAGAERRAAIFRDYDGAQERLVHETFASAHESGEIDAETLRLFNTIYTCVESRNRMLRAGMVGEAHVETMLGDAFYSQLLTLTPPGHYGKQRAAFRQLGKEFAPKPPWTSAFVPDGTPVFTVTLPGTANTLYSPLPPGRVDAILDAQRKTYLDLTFETYLGAYRAFLESDAVEADRLLHEMAVHLFRRDRYAFWCDYEVAWWENRILEDYFGETLARTPFAWEPGVSERVLRIVPEAPGAEYISAVGADYILWLHRGPAVLVFLVLAGGVYTLSRGVCSSRPT